VAYTVWKDGKPIGQTDLELSPGGRRRAGTFHPNEYGLTILPGITAMLPALFAFGDMCRRKGIDVNDRSSDAARLAREDFDDTMEGRAVLEAAKHVGEVEVRDSRGRTVVWDSLMINDVRHIRALARDRAGNSEPTASGDDEAFYFISVTLAPRLRPGFDRRGLGDAPIPVC